jgi:hypothetical protein
MTAETLSIIAAAVLSLAFGYIPGLRKVYEPLQPEQKQAVMALLLLGVVLAAFGLACAGWLALLSPDLAITCDQAGAAELVRALFLALAVNQGVHQISKRAAR